MEMSFESYDRFFPNQDTMPSGGFGNLIALNRLPREKGDRVFLDDFFSALAKPMGVSLLGAPNEFRRGRCDSYLSYRGRLSPRGTHAA
jgi:hypothetical protein